MSTPNEFITPEFCAFHIMTQLYDGPAVDPWVVVEQENGICFPAHLHYAMENEDKYFEITWNPNGKMILEANK
jgi:hypothetical protein